MGHLTPKDEKRIIKLIEEWSGPKLTWPLLVDACKEKLGISRARQSLMKLPAVDLAMKNSKAGLKAQKLKPGWISDIQAANEHIEKLTATNQKQKAVLDAMYNRFVNWQASAHSHGVTQQMLDEPVIQLKYKKI